MGPQKGMLTEIIKENETWLFCEGSAEELAKLLRRISTFPNIELARVGNKALKASKHLTISEVSTRLFRSWRVMHE